MLYRQTDTSYTHEPVVQPKCSLDDPDVCPQGHSYNGETEKYCRQDKDSERQAIRSDGPEVRIDIRHRHRHLEDGQDQIEGNPQDLLSRIVEPTLCL